MEKSGKGREAIPAHPHNCHGYKQIKLSSGDNLCVTGIPPAPRGEPLGILLSFLGGHVKQAAFGAKKKKKISSLTHFFFLPETPKENRIPTGQGSALPSIRHQQRYIWPMSCALQRTQPSQPCPHPVWPVGCQVPSRACSLCFDLFFFSFLSSNFSVSFFICLGGETSS